MTRAEAVVDVLNLRSNKFHTEAEVVAEGLKVEKPLIREMAQHPEAMARFRGFVESGLNRANDHPATPFIGILSIGWAAAVRWMEANAVKEPSGKVS